MEIFTNRMCSGHTPGIVIGITLLAMLLLVGSVSANEQVVRSSVSANERVVFSFSDNFESDALGSYPSGWVNIFSGSSGIITHDGKGGGNAFTISAQPWYGRSDGISVPKADVWENQYDVMVKTPSTNAWGNTAGDLFQKTDPSNGVPSAGVGFTNDGKMYIVDRGGSLSDIYLKKYVSKKWYNVKIRYNFKDLSMSVWVDGQQLADDVAISSPPDYQYVQFGANWGWTMAYDNVKIVGKNIEVSVPSNNWAGYVVTGTSVTDVKGSWTVPTVTCTSKTENQFSSFWIGIDGYHKSNKALEQIGTHSDCKTVNPKYYAWYEFLPASETKIDSMTIHPGDSISAEVKYESGKFTVSIWDMTTGQSFFTSANVISAERTSAEWIAEAPKHFYILPLANFDEANFGYDYTGMPNTNFATISGKTCNIESFGSNVRTLIMQNRNGKVDMAAPSPLSTDGTSFRVFWESSG